MGKGAWLQRLGLGRPRRLLSLEEFRDRVATEVLQRFPNSEVTRKGEDELEISISGADGGWVNVRRAHALYEDAPNDLDRLVVHLIDLLDRPDKPATPEALIVLVRPSAFDPDRDQTDPARRGLARPIAGNLVAMVAIDSPDSYVLAHASTLRRELALSDAEIWARALSNTRAKQTIEPRRLEVERPTEFSDEIGLAASLIADDEFWNNPLLTERGALVVAPMARSCIFVAPLSGRRSAEGLRELMRSVGDDPNGLGSDLLLRRNGRWELMTDA